MRDRGDEEGKRQIMDVEHASRIHMCCASDNVSRAVNYED